MFCEKCGKELPADARFCEHCGNPVTREESLLDRAKRQDQAEHWLKFMSRPAVQSTEC